MNRTSPDNDESSRPFLSRECSSPNWTEPELGGLRSITKYASYPPTQFSITLQRCLIFLIPSFISPHSNLQFQVYKPSSTSWLDGLRGIAAAFVFIHHYIGELTVEGGYAWDPVRHPSLWNLPIVRLFHAGSAMVRIFFVISGFALTCKSAKLMRRPESQRALMKSIGSSVIRRYLRLYLPCFGAFFIIHCLRAWGAFDWFEARQMGDSKHKTNPNILGGTVEKFPEKSPNGFYGQMGIMLTEFWGFAVGKTILNHSFKQMTDNHLWTIPTEYSESMYLFLLVAMVAHVRRKVRMFIIIPWCYGFWVYYKKFDRLLFLSGYLLAEIHAGFDSSPSLPKLELSLSPRSAKGRVNSRRNIAMTAFWALIAFIGLWLLSFPYLDGENTFGYVTLCKFFSSYSYYENRVAWQGYGASSLCLALLYLPGAQQCLSMPVIQYLGRISFSLYLVHGAVIRTLGHRLILEGWQCFGTDGSGGKMVVNMAVFFLAVLPVTIWVSDVFWRAVEAPSVNLVKWLEGLVIVKDQERVHVESTKDVSRYA